MFDANTKLGVENFTRFVLNRATPELAEWLVDNGLMIPLEEDVFKTAREIFFGMSHGAWLSFCMNNEIATLGKNDMQYNFFLDFTEHSIYGHDKEDSDSVGGFSQREMDLICNHLRRQENANRHQS